MINIKKTNLFRFPILSGNDVSDSESVRSSFVIPKKIKADDDSMSELGVEYDYS